MEFLMKAMFTGALLGCLMTSLPAKADFQIAPTRPDAVSATQGGLGPSVLGPGVPAPAVRQRRATQSMAVPAIPVAHGFGDDVPLAFAVRQIVPPKVKVTFGPGVDQAELVNWRGGRPWTAALQAAVRPLGLRVAVRWMAVSIIRA